MMRLKDINDKWAMIIGIPAIALIGLIAFSDMGDLIRHNLVIYQLISSVIFTALVWLGCRTIVGYLWKRFPWHLEPLPHLVLEIILIALWVGVMIILSSAANRYLMHDAPEEEWKVVFAIVLLISYLITAIHEGVMFYQQWQLHFHKSEQFQRKTLQAQYETLKTQINPHFLFNSLNTLMAYVEDNPRASEFVESLSDFMRYVLHNRDKELVLLREELRMVKQYAFIQKSRFGEGLKISFDVDEKYYHLAVVPLSIQMLFENVIKHNVISASKPLIVSVVVGEGPSLCVENAIQRKDEVDSTGVGLVNISERYSFLTRRSVGIFDDGKIFRVCLPLLEAEL